MHSVGHSIHAQAFTLTVYARETKGIYFSVALTICEVASWGHDGDLLMVPLILETASIQVA